MSVSGKRWREQNPERSREASRRQWANNRVKHCDRMKRYYDKTKDQYRVRWTRKAIKTLAEKEQIAGRPRPTSCELSCGSESLQICFDHDHETGKFRGWICHKCNLLLGQVNDDPALLRRMAGYLEAFQCPAPR